MGRCRSRRSAARRARHARWCCRRPPRRCYARDGEGRLTGTGAVTIQSVALGRGDRWTETMRRWSAVLLLLLTSLAAGCDKLPPLPPLPDNPFRATPTVVVEPTARPFP